MIETWIVWLIGYLLVGFGLMFMVRDRDTKWVEVISIPIDWPIRVALCILFCAGTIFVSIYTEVKDFIKQRRWK